MEFFGFLAPSPAPVPEAKAAGMSSGLPPPATQPATDESFTSTHSTPPPHFIGEQPAPSFNAEEKAVLEEPAPFVDFGPIHERALSYLRWRRDAAVAAEPNLSPSDEVGRDDRLWRFAIAKQFDMQAAGDMYVNMLRWRRNVGMDAIRSALLAANPLFFGSGGSTLQAIHLGDEDRQLLEDIYPRTWCRAVAADGDASAGFEPLLDRQGNLVYIESPAFVSWADLASSGAEAYSLASMRAVELLQLVLDELSRRAGRLVLTLRVLDFLEYRVVNPFKGSKEKEGERLAKEVGRPYPDAYPTTTYKNFLINAPAANIIKPLIPIFVPARSAKKTVVLGSKFADELLRECDAANLPVKLGGTLPDPRWQWTRRR